MIFIKKILPNGHILCSDGKIRKPACRKRFVEGQEVVVDGELVLGHEWEKMSTMQEEPGLIKQEPCPEGSLLLILRYVGGAKDYYCLNIDTGVAIKLSGPNDGRVKKELREKLVDLEKICSGLTVPKTSLFHWREINTKYYFILGDVAYSKKTYYVSIYSNGYPTILDTVRTCEKRVFGKGSNNGGDSHFCGPTPDMFRNVGGWYPNRQEWLNNATTLMARLGYAFIDKVELLVDKLCFASGKIDLAVKKEDPPNWTFWADFYRIKGQFYNLDGMLIKEINFNDILEQYVQQYVSTRPDEYEEGYSPDYPIMLQGMDLAFGFVPIFAILINENWQEIGLVEAMPFLGPQQYMSRIRLHEIDIRNEEPSLHSLQNLWEENWEYSEWEDTYTSHSKLYVQSFNSFIEAWQTKKYVTPQQPPFFGYGLAKWLDVDAEVKVHFIFYDETYKANYKHMLGLNVEGIMYEPITVSILNCHRHNIEETNTWLSVMVYSVAKTVDYWYYTPEPENDYIYEGKSFQKYRVSTFVVIGTKKIRLELTSDIVQIETDAVRQKLLELHNQAREENGLEPLEEDGALDLVAQRHSNDMATNHFFSHTGTDGLSPSGRYDEEGIIYETCGENIGQVVSEEIGDEELEQIFNDWMASEEHRANILNPSFKRLGIGYKYDDETQTWKITCDFADLELQNFEDAEYLFADAGKTVSEGYYYASTFRATGHEIRDVSIAISDEKVLVSYAVVELHKQMDKAWFSDAFSADQSWSEYPFQEEIVARIFAFYDYNGNLLWRGQIGSVPKTRMTAGFFEGAA